MTLFINDQQVATISHTPPAGGGQVGMYAESSITSPSVLDFSDYVIAVP